MNDVKSRYNYSEGFKVFIGFCFAIILFVAAAGGMFQLRKISQTKAIATLIVTETVWLGLGYSFYRILRRLDDYIEVDKRGIAIYLGGKTRREVAWENISKLKERIMLQRLEIFNEVGEKTIAVEYQISHYKELRDYIIEHVKHLHKSKKQQ